MKVTLEWYEMEMAAVVGVKRVVSSREKGLRHKFYNENNDDWRQSVEGTCAEVAVAKAFNVLWNGSVDTFKAPDVIIMGKPVQVRLRKSEWHDLIVRKNDKDDDIFLMVIGVAPSFEIVGWISGRDAKKSQWYKDPSRSGQAAYFVPKDFLHPVSMDGWKTVEAHDFSDEIRRFG